jgi:DNA-binding MarR family transcriptional regulator
MRAWMRYVKSTELTMPQFNILMRLYYKGGCGITDISAHMDVTAAAASQLVDRLVQMKLIERVEDPHDRRAKQISLSAKGRALIERGIEVRNHWVEKLDIQLNPEDRQAAIATLERLTEAARKLNRDE